MTTMRAAGLLLGLVAVGACGGADAPERPDAPTSDEALVIGEILHARLAGIDDTEGLWIQNPTSFALWRDSIAVADGGAARIHLLSPDLSGGRSFGATGEGPGELLRPARLQAVDDTLVVYDRAGRVTWFTASGTAVHQQSLLIGSMNPGFVAGPNREVWYPVREPEWYARVVRDGVATPAIPRDSTLVHSGPLGVANALVPHASGPIAVDMENALVIFSNRGEPVTVSPPPEVYTRLRARADELTSPPERWANPFIGVGRASDGVVVWFPFESGEVGAIVTVDGSWTPIRTGTTEVPAYAEAILVVGGRLYLGSSDGVRIYRLEPSPVIP